METPRIVIAAARSGLGKTSVSTGIVRTMVDRGLVVQPFKVGPDYIDPGFLSQAAGRVCRNIDTMLVDQDTAIGLAERAAQDADVVVIEGVMGLFDGASGTDERGSTGHVARLLDAPVIVILDAARAARSVGAVALGFTQFDPRVRVAGFVLNQVASETHEALLVAAITDATGLPVLGALRRDSLPPLPSRHLGLVPAWEHGDDTSDAVADLATHVSASLDMDALLALAQSAPASPPARDRQHRVATPAPRGPYGPTIAYALDDAFHFYYEDNLDALRDAGARLEPFSPISDKTLPAGTAGVYLGGGYPELHAAKLAANEGMKTSILSAIDAGVPVLAECGGLMYLCSALEDADKVTHSMVGAFDISIRMERRLSALGYHTARMHTPIPWVPEVMSVAGHVYHWSAITHSTEKPAWSLEKHGREPQSDGFIRRNCVASYLHLHFAGEEAVAHGLVNAARHHAPSQ